MISEQNIDNNIAQGFASYVDYINNIRFRDLLNSLDIILELETNKLSDLSGRSADALVNIEWAKIEIDNLIYTNRGGITGIHGFIAEFAETGIRNARDTFHGLQKSTILLNNNGASDILLHGQDVQMKFYNNIYDGINQASKYDDMTLMIPKDHMNVINQIMSGEKNVEFNGNPLRITKITNIKEAIEAECNRRGINYEEIFIPSVNQYDDVKKGTIHQTLSKEIDDIKKQTQSQKADIAKEANDERLNANQQAQPSFDEASKVAAIGAVVQGGLNLGIFVYRKRKDGKDVWEFDSNDWIECGASTVKGIAKGGISGYSIYGLTNVCQLSAPSAGAITSGTFGLSNAIIKYRKGDVDTDGFIDLITFNAMDAAGAAIGAAIGQTIIPIPVVGALVGSIVSTTMLSLGKDMFNKHELQVINAYQESLNNYIANLDTEYQTVLKELYEKYQNLGELQEYSFDLNLNIKLNLENSIILAREVGVKESDILKNELEIDEYFIC